MKTTLVWTMILFTLSLFIALPHTAAVDTSEWGLPEGAKARLGKGVVRDLTYSPDGTLLAVASRIGIWLYDTETLQERALLTGHTNWINSVSFSPDGNTIASGSEDTTLRLWDVATATHRHTLTEHTRGLTSVSFSPDGNTIASGSRDNTVRLWDVATGTLKHTLTEHTGRVNSVVFSPDGNTIASGSRDNTVRLWDVATGTLKHTLTGHSDEIWSAAFSPDGGTIASGSQDRTVRLWDGTTGTLKHTLTGHSSVVTSVSFSPDGNTIASGGWDGVRLWDAPTGTQKRILTGHRDEIRCVAFSPDGNTIASGGTDTTVLLWDVATVTHKHTLQHTGWVRSVSFSPDGNTIAIGNWVEVRLWDVATGTLKHTFTGHTSFVNSVAFSPDGKTIASGSNDNTVRLWDVETGTQKGTLQHTDEVNSVMFSPDGRTIASGSRDTTVLLWDVETGTLKHTLTGHSDEVWSVAFSPDGRTIASGGNDNTVLLWDVATGTQKGTLTGHTIWVRSVSFSPDGKTLTSGSWFDVRLWDVATGTLKHTLTGHTGLVYSVAFSPDGTTLASGSNDGTVLLWDLTPYLDIAPETPVPTDDPDPLLTLQSDPFDGTGQDLQSFWQVQNGDKSSWELKDGQLVVDAGFNQNLWNDDTSTRFYQVTDQDQFTVETSMVVDYADVCVVSGLVVSSPTTESSYGEGEWVMLKFWGRSGSSVLQYQNRGEYIVSQHPGYNPVQGPTRISMRMERNGDDYTAWFKPDAEGDWVFVGKTTIALQEPLQVGLYTGICQPEASGHLTTTFDYFQLTSDPIVPEETPEKEEPTDVAATVSLSPDPSESPVVGEQLILNLNVTGGESIKGYQATVQFDETALRYVSSDNADFLLPDTFVAPPIISENSVTIAAASYVGETNGDGTLATLTFEIVGQKASTLTLTEVLFSDSEGMLTRPHLEPAELTITPKPAFPAWDVNEDGSVNILDLVLVGQNIGGSIASVPRADVNGDGSINILDLVLVAGHFGETTNAAAPESVVKLDGVDPALVKKWLELAQLENDGSSVFRQGIANLERLLATLIPQETALLANYPNPFNPETWIPYQLAKPAEVNVSIYAADGKLIRTLALGHQAAGVYHNRSRAAYWDGKNATGESVASGVYFYTLKAGDFTATRKMLILK